MPEFQIRPTYELDVKTIALEDDKPELGVFVKIVPKWSITAMLSDLVASRVDFAWIIRLRRHIEKGERRLVGRSDRLENGVVHLSEHYARTDSVAANDVMLERSRCGKLERLR